MAKKLDIVALKWVVGLMNKQADNAEFALVAYGNNSADKNSLLRCMWAVHQITSTLRAIGMNKGEMLTLEMERALNYIYKEKVSGERLKLTMGGLMQALKVLPAYLAHTQSSRMDTGQGLEQHINDLRRWLGERPRPAALFFHLDIPASAGLSCDGVAATDEEVKSSANIMLAPYLEMAKMALHRRNLTESMRTVARISRKMQLLFAGTEAERFWFALVGLCEGIAAGLIVPDECVAQIFKTGAFLIKYARENGSQIDPSVDYDNNLQQMLYYFSACKSKPVHISRIRHEFGIDDDTIITANRGLVHIDAVITAMTGAMVQLNGVVEFLNRNDLYQMGHSQNEEYDVAVLEGIEAAEIRLEAAGQLESADVLRRVRVKLGDFYRGSYRESSAQHEQVVGDIIRGIVDVKLDVEHKLAHGLSSSYSSKEYERRESVITATLVQMGLVENCLHQILRRKALAAALAKTPSSEESIGRLTLALNRHLNKSEQGHEALRQLVKDADSGHANVDLLYRHAREFLDEQEEIPERTAISFALEKLVDIAGALDFAGMNREASVIEQCQRWLAAASRAGSVREDDACRLFAAAFAYIELHFQRSLSDPLDDTSQLIAIAEQRAQELDSKREEVSIGADVASPISAASAQAVQDGDISAEFREVFIEESEEIVEELRRLEDLWSSDPQPDAVLRDIRRHFHTFKGNGRAVGANILGELGWAAQDMLDRVLDGEMALGLRVQALLGEVIAALPALVASYRNAGELDVMSARQLTNRCFAIAKSGERSQVDMPLSSPEAAERPVSPAAGVVNQ